MKKTPAVNSYVKSFSVFFPIYKAFIISIVTGSLFFVLDYYNIGARVFNQFPIVIWIVFMLCAASILLCWLIHIGYLGLFRIPSVTVLDATIIIFLCSTLLYSLFNLFLLRSKWLHISKFVCLILSLLALFRIIYYRYSQKKSSEFTTNVFDLKDIYDDTFTRVGNGPILIEEADADYDLLERKHLINQLVYSIENCKSLSSFVIGLDGPWGSGKTTIINNAKHILQSNPKSPYIICDFDPWIFGTQEACLWGMYDAIFKSSGTKFSVLQNHRLFQQLSLAVVDNYAVGRLLKPLALRSQDRIETLQELKNKIEAYLATNKQTIIFFIDNIDRAEAKNVILLFKLIGTVFSLPRIIYVLAYDKNRVSRIFEDSDELDPHYIDKIIQQEIQVPSIKISQFADLCSTCVEHLLRAYGVNSENLSDFAPAVKYIYSSISDLRQFKRLVNSAFSTVFSPDVNLYKPDLLALETIRFVDFDLYMEIYKMRQFYISHDTHVDLDLFQRRLHGAIDKKTSEEEVSRYFDSLFARKGNAKDLLANMFPFVRNYIAKKELNGLRSSDESKETIDISNNTKICSAKYFDLYFSYSSNDYLQINENVKKFVEAVFKQPDYTAMVELVSCTLTHVTSDDQKEWFEQLENKLYTLSAVPYFLAKALFNQIYSVDDTQYFFGLNARQRCLLIITDILCLCEDADFSDFLLTAKDYGKLRVLTELIYWLDNQKGSKQEIASIRKKQLEQIYQSLCATVLNDQINLYSDEYYHSQNIYGLYNYCSGTNSNTFQLYIRSVASSKNIYRLLWDATARSVGERYYYSLSAKDLALFFSDEAIVDRLLTETHPHNESEQFVMSIYAAFKSGNPDHFGRGGITKNKDFKPIL